MLLIQGINTKKFSQSEEKCEFWKDVKNWRHVHKCGIWVDLWMMSSLKGKSRRRAVKHKEWQESKLRGWYGKVRWWDGGKLDSILTPHCSSFGIKLKNCPTEYIYLMWSSQIFFEQKGSLCKRKICLN